MSEPRQANLEADQIIAEGWRERVRRVGGLAAGASEANAPAAVLTKPECDGSERDGLTGD